MGARHTDQEWETWVRKMQATFGNDGHGKSLTIEARRMLKSSRYAPALDHWAHLLGREAPDPVIGGHVNAWFVEWMMGLDEGWVCGVAGISWVTAVEALGRGVVPQQAEAAFSRLNRLRASIMSP